VGLIEKNQLDNYQVQWNITDGLGYSV